MLVRKTGRMTLEVMEMDPILLTNMQTGVEAKEMLKDFVEQCLTGILVPQPFLLKFRGV